MSASSLLRVNPELQRCLWLELTPTRLVLMPVLLGLVLAGLHLIGTPDLAEWIGYALYFLLLLWGTRLAAESFADEVAQGTWDIQRLSAVNPVGLALGKLVGGTIYVWYGAVWCLLALPFVPGKMAAEELAGILIGGLSGQAAALMVAMLLHGFDANRRRGSTALAQVVGIVAGIPSLGMAAALSSVVREWGTEIHWFGAQFDVGSFTLTQQVVTLGWWLLGLAWMVRRHLGHAPSPWPYLAFAVYQMAFCSGFLFAGDLVPPLPVVTGIAALAGAALAYVSLFTTPWHVADVKRLMLAGTWAKRWSLLPSWLPVAVLAVILGAVSVLSGGREWSLAAAALALFVRDIALVAAVRLLSRRRTTLLLLVLAVLLYGLLPEVLDAIGGMGLRAWIFPTLDAPAFTLAGPWAQALMALSLAGWAWKRRKGQ
ncbi:hypothetical protein [Magnetospirillum sp. 64-120]|uniref:hypothetical protein n=1 Tax=Magnetospirillum sp. 64-120 TaxID=1895778 RepID=UPI000929662E|nr:hypothetical protein [Magnetospirillum sp. 64-120]OJX80924.1 MAG: hypothetical protein BGO92_07465 [Magnetospirillum sp. 64-120]